MKIVSANLRFIVIGILTIDQNCQGTLKPTLFAKPEQIY